MTISAGIFRPLQTGVVEGFTRRSIPRLWSHQAVDHFSVTEHIYQPALIVANKKWFDSLPAEIQSTMISIGERLDRADARVFGKLGPALPENFKSQGVKVYEIYGGREKRVQGYT